MALFAFSFVLLALPLIAATPSSASESTSTADIQTRMLVDVEGSVHVLWVVPALNGSVVPPGVWYGKYSPNGTDTIAPTLITNSTTVQSADFAVDLEGNAAIVWSKDTGNASQSSSALYYLKYNSTSSHRTQILATRDSLVMWPSVVMYNNSVSQMVWTLYSPSTKQAFVEYGALSGANLTYHEPLMSYNHTDAFPPKARLGFSAFSGYLDVAWGESHSGNEPGSSVDYVKLQRNGTIVSTLQLAKFDEPFHDIQMSVASNAGGSFVIWQSDLARAPVYVAQISRAGRLVYLKQLNYANSGGTFLAVSTDSQNNLYIVWFQPSDLNALYLHSPQSRVPASKVAYLSIDDAGDIVNTGNQVFRGPLIGATISSQGDLYVVSPSGFVKIATSAHQNELGWPAAFAVVGCVALVGAFSTEEGRYRIASRCPTPPWIMQDRSSEMQTEIVRLLGRRPGLKLSDFRKLTDEKRVGLFALVQMEKKGAIRSLRDGLSRRFYSYEGTSSSGNYLSNRIMFFIREHPGVWEAQLAKDLAISQQIVHYHLKRLLAQGLITGTLEPDGKRKLYHFNGTA